MMKRAKNLWRHGCLGLLLVLAALWGMQTEARARRCSKKVMKIMRSATSAVKAKALRAAIRKTLRRAKDRCKRRAPRRQGAWKLRCRRNKKTRRFRCKATARFRCCRRTKQKAHPPRARRKGPRARRKGLRVRHKGPGRCTKRFVRRARATERTRKAAQQVARQKVYERAKQRCAGRKLQYIGAWRYRCKKVARGYSCRAENAARCCGKVRRPSRPLPPVKRPLYKDP